jgi:hypothetical protein
MSEAGNTRRITMTLHDAALKCLSAENTRLLGLWVNAAANNAELTRQLELANARIRALTPAGTGEQPAA